MKHDNPQHMPTVTVSTHHACRTRMRCVPETMCCDECWHTAAAWAGTALRSALSALHAVPLLLAALLPKGAAAAAAKFTCIETTPGQHGLPNTPCRSRSTCLRAFADPSDMPLCHCNTTPAALLSTSAAPCAAKHSPLLVTSRHLHYAALRDQPRWVHCRSTNRQ